MIKIAKRFLIFTVHAMFLSGCTAVLGSVDNPKDTSDASTDTDTATESIADTGSTTESVTDTATTTESATDSPVFQDTKFYASDGEANDFFGASVSISGGIALVGIPGDGDNGMDSGAVYIFERNKNETWEWNAVLLASDGGENDNFGCSVSLSGNTALIGARSDDDKGGQSGSAYIFERNESGIWEEKAKLLADDGATMDWFGSSVSVSSTIALVGAYGDDDNDVMSGSAYIFERNGSGTWEQTAKLLASDGAGYDLFATSVSVSGNIALVGAPAGDGKLTDSGSTYIFERNDSGTWEQTAKLLAPDEGAGLKFGSSVSVSGNIALVGAEYDDDKGLFSGSAYIFERKGLSTWDQKAKLLAYDGATADVFGSSVSVSGTIALVGARNGDVYGSAFIFKQNGSGIWEQTAKLVASDGTGKDGWFGQAVSLSGNIALVGAPYGYGKDPGSGSAYVYDPIP